MTGWLIYEADNISRNQFFIDRWMDAAQARKVRIHLALTRDIAWGVREGSLFVRHAQGLQTPDFVVMRTNQPLLSEHLESMGIPCFNNARVARIANDKRATHMLFSQRLPMMDTAFVTPSTFHMPFQYPVVVKAAHGCGGRQVFLAHDRQAYQNALNKIAPDEAVVQPLSDQPGRDLRVYVLGDRVVAGMLRSAASDFRGNLGLGGDSAPTQIPEDVLQYVDVVKQSFSFGLVGVDFIFHQGRAVFNEIEDAVGTRMLYQHTHMDIVQEYLDLIMTKL